jgi:hypothetical protein
MVMYCHVPERGANVRLTFSTEQIKKGVPMATAKKVRIRTKSVK